MPRHWPSQLAVGQFFHRAGRQGMTAATNFCKSGSAIDDHDAQPARVRVQFLFIQHDGGRQVSLFPSTHHRNIGDQILFRQVMTATDDLFESLAAAHDFDDQSTGMLIPFELVEDIAFFECHNPSTGEKSLSFYNVATFDNRSRT